MPRLLPILVLLCSCSLALAQFTSDQETVPVIEYPNAPIDQILTIYGQLTGKQIITDNSVYQGGNVGVVIKGPVPREEAIRIIEINLLLNGFSIVPDGEKIVKILGAARSPTMAGVPMFTSPIGLPDREQVVTYLFKLRYANPNDITQVLASYATPLQSWTRIIPVPSAQQILVTETTSVIRSLIDIVNQIDIPPAEVVSEFITLQRADAQDVLEKLQSIFETDPNAVANQATQRTVNNLPPAPPSPDGAPSVSNPAPNTVEISAGLSENSIIVGKIRLTADVRTNRIHVVTRPVNLPFLRDLIAQFDSDVKFGEPTTRPLKFVSAGEILPVIVQAISEPGVDPANNPAGQTPGGTANAPRATPVNGGGFSGGGASSGGGGGSFTVSEGLATDPVDTAPEAVTVGNTKIIADKRSNSIIVLGNEEVKQKIFRVLDEIDKRAPQVLLNTVIGEMTLGDNQTFGVDYLYRSVGGGTPVVSADGTTTTIPNPTGSAIISRTTSAPLLDLGNITNAASLAAAGSGFTALVAPIDSLQVLVTALESTSRFRVTSRPMLYTSNNKKAIIASGQEVAVPVSSLTSLTGGNNVPSVQSSIQYKTIALQLEVVPLINSDREVSLDILQKVDNISGSTIIDGNAIPTISTRYIKTNVSVPNRGTIVLGGLITRTKDKGYSGLPLLSRIPLIGPLFRTTRDNDTRSELIILMRPVVTWDPEESVALREPEEQRLHIEPDLDATLTPPGERRVLRGEREETTVTTDTFRVTAPTTN